MANTHVFETRMSKRMQASFIDKPVFRSIVNSEERANLSNGQSVTRPYRSLLRGQSYTRNGSLTFQDVTETNETLTVNTIKSTPFKIDDFDQVQSNFNLIREWSGDATDELKSLIDGDVLSEVANAALSVDDSDFGGISGNPITLDTSNVFPIFNKGNMKLRRSNVDVTGLDPRMDMKAKGMPGVGGVAGYGVFSPFFHSILEEAEQGREDQNGDKVGKNGFVKRRGAMDLFVSNNIYWTALLSTATNPTNGDTLTISDGNQTVTITFVSSIGTTAGNVLIGGSADITRVNLAAIINDPSTTSANQVAFSNTRAQTYWKSPRELISDLTATDDATANTTAIAGDGIGYLILGETLTASADGWSKEIQHNMMGKKGAIDMVAQVGVGVKVSDIESGFGSKIKPRVLYGLKTFVEGANRMIDVKINTASFA